MRMKVAVILCLLMGIWAAAYPGEYRPAAPGTLEPLTSVQVRALVNARIPSSRVAMLARQRGIDFAPTDAYLTDLQQAGAGQDTLEALKAAAQSVPVASSTQGEQSGAKPKPRPSLAQAGGEARVPVSAQTQAAKLVYKRDPVISPLTRRAGKHGTVRMNALIDKDGTVDDLQVISGYPVMLEPAIMAASEWRYRTTLLNGKPVAVLTEIDVDY